MTDSINSLIADRPPGTLARTLDKVLIDYACMCIRDQQSDPTEEAILNIQTMKAMRDAFLEAQQNNE